MNGSGGQRGRRRRRIADDVLNRTVILGLAMAIFFSAIGVVVSFPLAVMGMLGLIGFLFIWRYPEWGIYGIVFLMPLGVFGQFSFLSPIKIVGIATVTVWFLKRFLAEKAIAPAVQNIVVLFFIVIFMVSGFNAYDFGEVKATLLNFVMVLLFYFLIINLIDTERKFRIIVWSALLSMTISAAGGVLSYIVQKPLFMTRRAHLAGGARWGEEVPRIHGTGDFGPNELGSVLAFIIPLTIVLMYRSNRKWERLILGGIAVTCLAADALTYSRGSWVAIAAVIPLLLWRIRDRLRSPLTVIVSVIGILGMVVLMPDKVFDRASSISDTKTDVSIKGRLSYKVAALYMARDHPLFGVGPGNFNIATALPAYRDFVDVTEQRYQTQEQHGGATGRVAHDMYSEVVAELGFPGIAVFVTLLLLTYRSIKRVMRILQARGNESFLAYIYGIEVGYVCLLLNGWFLSNEYLEYLWLVIALAVAAENLVVREPAGSLPGPE